jgi:outer membrane lipoprotein-sorting protein
MRNIIRSTPMCLILVGTMACQSVNADEPTATRAHPLEPAIRYAQQCLEKVQALPGYEATFVKREVVGNSTVSHKMKIKVRHNPFSVYLYFENPHAGREVIYVDGRNNGKLVAHEAGLLSFAGAMDLTPTDSIAMNENRYPITKAGIANTMQIMISQWQEEARYGETDVKYYKDAKLDSMTCKIIESSHPQPRKQFNNHMVRLWIDNATGLPVRMQKFGFPRRAAETPPIVEDYSFLNLQTDVRLTDADFDRNNKKYSF